MAKRNKDRSSSRPFEGGLRKTKAITELSRSIEGRRWTPDPLEAIGGAFRTPDLSAFEPEVYRPLPVLTDYDRILPPQARARMVTAPTALQARAAQSRAALARTAEREASRRTLEPSQTRPLTGRPEQSKVPAASKLDTHEVRHARVEPTRQNCKERPMPVKKGHGSGKSFVPWCERKKR